MSALGQQRTLLAYAYNVRFRVYSRRYITILRMSGFTDKLTFFIFDYCRALLVNNFQVYKFCLLLICPTNLLLKLQWAYLNAGFRYGLAQP